MLFKMKFERIKERDDTSKDDHSYRKFLAGNKTLYAQAFWENRPRPKNAKPSAEKLVSDAWKASG